MDKFLRFVRFCPLCFALILVLGFACLAVSGEQERLLSFDDPRVLAGNRILDEDLAKSQEELNRTILEFQKDLPLHLRAYFEENQLDWKVYFEDELRAFQAADAWTRENADSEYENLYRHDLIFATRCRTRQIEDFQKRLKNPDGKKDRVAEINFEARQKNLLWKSSRPGTERIRGQKNDCV